MGYSGPSPKGRDIEQLVGDPGAIEERGNKIIELADAMEDASMTLQAAEQGDFNENLKGKYADKLKEGIGEAWSVLGEAAELYRPVGPVLVSYAWQLDNVQGNMNTLADECEQLWARYESLEGDKDGSMTPEEDGGFLGIGGHDADSPEAKKEAEDNQAKLAAYEDWHDAASNWDVYYDSWEDAFDEATAGITNGTGGQIKDEFMEYFDNFVEILEVVALVVGVLALFLAGPFAAIALALAAAVLIAKTIQAANGHAEWEDVAWAAVDILPFGKLGKLGKLGKYTGDLGALKKADGFVSAAKKFAGDSGKFVGDAYKDARKFGDFAKIHRAASAADGNLLARYGKAAWQNGNPNGGVDLVTRNFMGMEAHEMGASNFSSFDAGFETVHNAANAFQGMVSIPGDAAEKVFGQEVAFDPFSKGDVRALNFL